MMISKRYFAITLTIILLFGFFISSFQKIGGEEIESTSTLIGVISHQTVGDVNACWNPKSDEFIIVGGQDLFGKNDQVHVRYVYLTNGDDLELILNYDDPDFKEYQRFVDVSVHPKDNFSLITQLHSGVWKLTDGILTQVYSDPETPFWTVTWEPYGKYAIFGTWDRLFRYDNDGTVTEIETGGHGCIEYSWAPGGDYVLLADNDPNEIGWYDGEKFKTLDLPSDGKELNVQTVAFSPIEEFALIGTQWSMVDGPYQNLYSFDGKNFKIIREELNSFPETPYWSPDGIYAFIPGQKNLKFNILNRTLIDETDIPEYGRILGIHPNGDYMLSLKSNYSDDYRDVEVELWRWNLKPSEPEEEDISNPDEETPFISITIIILSSIILISVQKYSERRSI
ncbi:MAG: hypothetical protein ACMUIE_10275 [Thermoplasmatota archaeon]